MNINGLKLNADIVDILDVYAEALHEKNCLISAKDTLIVELQGELSEEKRISSCRLRAISDLEIEVEKLKAENEKLKRLKEASEEVKKIMEDIKEENKDGRDS